MGSSAFEKVLSLLESIRTTESGKIIFEHVSDMLAEIDSRGNNIERVYSEMLSSLLKAISSQFDSNEQVAVQIKMLQLRLVPPIAKSELITLKKYIDSVSVSLVTNEKNTENLTSSTQKELIRQDNKEFFVNNNNSIDQIDNPHTDTENKIAETKTSESLKNQFDSLYQHYVNKKNKEINDIRDGLARHVSEAIAQNEQFGVLLGVELEALKETTSLQDVDDRRAALVDEISRLIGNHAHLSEKFSNASKYLTMIESDNQQLSVELDRVRLLSLTDELTTLPNRRAFMRRLEDEVGRVKRYGYPISLTLMDLDRFKSVNDEHGHAGGDAVLRSYAEEALTIFRHHDMIARYGGEEFAVILPNTDKAGALSALRKVQHGVSQIFCVLKDETIQMPTFSAGLAQYIDGETPAQFIERADEALYRAKELGRNRIELATDDKVKNGGFGSGISAGHG